MIFIAKGNAFLGQTKTDKDGNVVERTPPRFDEAEDGGCVAVGIINPDTNQQEGSADIFGDWQAAEYLQRVLELLNPRRKTNIPNLREIIHDAYNDGGVDICEYCGSTNCSNCIIDEWKNETEE